MAPPSGSVAKACVISIATLELLSVLFGLGWGWVRTLGASDTVTTWITPVDLAAKVVPHLHVPAVPFLDVAHVVGPVLAVAIGLWALRRLPDIGLPRAMGIALMAVVLLGPTVQPWYLLWSVPILAITAGPRTATVIKGLSVAVCLLGVVGLGQLTGELGSLGTRVRGPPLPGLGCEHRGTDPADVGGRSAPLLRRPPRQALAGQHRRWAYGVHSDSLVSAQTTGHHRSAPLDATGPLDPGASQLGGNHRHRQRGTGRPVLTGTYFAPTFRPLMSTTMVSTSERRSNSFMGCWRIGASPLFSPR